MTQHRCNYCESTEITMVDSYKHQWLNCHACGNTQRLRKDSLFFDKVIFRRLFKKVYTLHNYLLPVKEIINEESIYYECYAEEVKMLSAKGTKWENMFDNIYRNLAGLNIDIKDRDVLDISGGPGFFAKAVSDKGEAKYVMITEYAKVSADAMEKYLGIDAVKYDYNSDELSDCIQRKFDIIFLNYSIGFCNDLGKLARSIRSVAKSGAVVYVSYSPPTLGLSMRWQFDEYTYNRCWQKETVTKQFAQLGFNEIGSGDDGSYAYNAHFNLEGKDFFWRPGIRHKVSSVILKKVRERYVRKALGTQSPINKELIQKNIWQVFQLG